MARRLCLTLTLAAIASAVPLLSCGDSTSSNVVAGSGAGVSAGGTSGAGASTAQGGHAGAAAGGSGGVAAGGAGGAAAGGSSGTGTGGSGGMGTGGWYTGTWADGSTVMLSGSFPSKNTAAPLFFTDFRNNNYQKVAGSASGITLNNYGNDGAGTITSSAPHSKGYCAKTDYNNNGPLVHLFLSGLSSHFNDRLYVNFWYKLSSTFNTVYNIKYCRMTGGGGSWPTNHEYLGDDGGPEYTKVRLQGESTCAIGNVYGSGHMGDGRTGWKPWEWFGVMNTQGNSDGKIWLRGENGLELDDSSFAFWGPGCNPQSSTYKWDQVYFPSNGHGIDTATNIFYTDSIYVDNTPTRVMIGNTPTYTPTTHAITQLATAWSTSSITIEVLKGDLGNLSGMYVYVFDNNNVATPLGQIP